MSLLSDFAKSAHSLAAAIIGQEALTISGGADVLGVMNEAAFNRDYEGGGFEQSATLDVVIENTAFAAVYPDPVKFYEGKSATARSESWRIGRISKGASFIQISLISSNKSA